MPTSQHNFQGDMTQLSYAWFGYLLKPHYPVALEINFHNFYLVGKGVWWKDWVGQSEDYSKWAAMSQVAIEIMLQ